MLLRVENVVTAFLTSSDLWVFCGRHDNVLPFCNFKTCIFLECTHRFPLPGVGKLHVHYLGKSLLREVLQELLQEVLREVLQE